MSDIGGNDLLSEISNQWPRLGQYLNRYVAKAIATTAFNAGVSATGNVAPPAPPESISVTQLGAEHLQIVVNHNAPVTKGIRYITHIATNPQFSNAMIHDHGCSRCPPPVFVPTKTSGAATQNYYVATVTQMPGSKPSVTYYGGASPVAINMSGTTEADILPGTGSGTAANGGETLVGLGKSQIRQAAGPKRQVGTQ
jgi:hypothetical protein